MYTVPHSNRKLGMLRKITLPPCLLLSPSSTLELMFFSSKIIYNLKCTMHLWTYNAVSKIIYLISHSFAFVLKIRLNMHLYFVQQDGSSGLGLGPGPHQWSLSDGTGSTISIWMSLQGWGFSHSCNDWSPTAFWSGLGTVLIPVSC